MGSIFDDIMATDLAFINSDAFSEPVVATLGASGQQISFNAVINRETVDKITGSDKGFAPLAEFWLPSTLFSAPPQQGDKFSYPNRAGEAASNHSFVSIQKQDASGWLVRCR